MQAHAAAREMDDPVAAAAARAAGLAAASAYTHPLRDVQQTKHIVGPAAYAALALALHHPGPRWNELSSDGVRRISVGGRLFVKLIPVGTLHAIQPLRWWRRLRCSTR